MWERVGEGECSTFQQCSRLHPDNTGPGTTVLPTTTINMLQCLNLGHCRSAPQQHGKGLLLALEVLLQSSIEFPPPQILIVLAWAGLVASAPQWSDLVSRSSPRGGVDTGNLVSAVLSGLDIQGAVASALRGRSQTSAGSRGPAGSVTTVRVGEWSAWSPVSGQVTQTVVTRPAVAVQYSAPAFTSQANTG